MKLPRIEEDRPVIYNIELYCEGLVCQTRKRKRIQNHVQSFPLQTSTKPSTGRSLGSFFISAATLGFSPLLSVQTQNPSHPTPSRLRTVLGKRCVPSSCLVTLDILSSSISHYLLASFIPVPQLSCSFCLRLWQRVSGTADPVTSSSAAI